MLKYQINIKNANNEFVKVSYESLYYALDTTYVTGVTDPSYCLEDESYVYVEGSLTTKKCAIEAKNVMRCGYTIYNQKFIIEENDGVKGITYIDGLFYLFINNSVFINNKEYNIKDDDTHIIIPVTYYAYDNQITINNITYDVIIEQKSSLTNDDDYYPYIILNESYEEETDRVLYIFDWEYSKRKMVTLFKIFIQPLQTLNVEKIECVSPSNILGKAWDKVPQSNFIDLYVTNNLPTNVHELKIFVKQLVDEEITLQIPFTSTTFTLYGQEYKIKEKEKHFITINDIKHEVFRYKYINLEGVECYDYYILNEMFPIRLKATTDTKDVWPSSLKYNQQAINYENNSTITTSFTYNVVSNAVVTIGNADYIVEEQEIENEIWKVVTCKVNFTVELEAYDVVGNNILRCYGGSKGDKSLYLEKMSLNPSIFQIEYTNSLLNGDLLLPIESEDGSYKKTPLVFYVSHASYMLPIKLENDTALNLHQDFILKEQFFNEKVEESINRIVDMEKDIYYPANYNYQKKVMTLCNEIRIDLHFRSRDLEKWTINESHTINEYGNRYPSTWNLFDFYRYPSDTTSTKALYPLLHLKGDNQYYPPSDLLYFLNFTNEDIFYQKLKVSKSFLRLSFYDSPNPNNQSLLYTTTVFMSETELFDKYINADKIQTSYQTVKDRGVMKDVLNENRELIKIYTTNNQNITHHIGVDTEPLENERKCLLSFNERQRLSCSFSLKNRYEASESSEGFYLYLFKEYSNGAHERSIYLRVQFNHAGEGKTVNFMQMYQQNGNKKKMINWASKYSYDKYKEGYPLNELYEHLYIEIKVKYDSKHKRFCYYLPEWLSENNSDKNLMRLSLFETKIKDESNESN